MGQFKHYDTRSFNTPLLFNAQPCQHFWVCDCEEGPGCVSYRIIADCV